MVATITLQLDDQTGPGWAQFIENIRKAEQRADALQQALDMRTAIVGIRQEVGEIAGLASALEAAANATRTLHDSSRGGPVQMGAPPPVQSPLAIAESRGFTPFDTQAAAGQRQQFQQMQLVSLLSGQGLESEQAKAQNQLLQAAVNRARAQGKVDKQIVQMLTDQIELEQQQQQAAEKTGQVLEKLQTALMMLLNANNNGAQQNRQGQAGGGGP